MVILDTKVAAEWVDYNGHMNDAEYARVFSLAVDALMVHIGLDATGRDHHRYTLYTLETHLCYQKEAHEGQSMQVKVTRLDHDAKRLHIFFELVDADNNLLATSEQMLMGINQETGRPSGFPEPISQAIINLPSAAAGEWPGLAGRTIGIPRKNAY